MKRYPLIAAALVIALVSLACGISFNVPVTNVETGPTETMDLSVPAPDAEGTVDLTFEFGAGELVLAPGADDLLVSGTATFNVADFEPRVESSGNAVSIVQGDLSIEAVPRFDDDIENRWDLQLGSMPIDLEIKAGAYSGEYELGGLSIESLDIADGAAQVNLTFTEPNQVEMSTFTYTTGASEVDLNGLANANFSRMTFRSGAGDYRLEFSGELQRDATVEIDSGVSSVEIVVPEGTAAEMTFDGALANVDIGSGWEKNGDTYTHAGEGPVIRINVDMGAGSVKLSE